MHAPPEADKTLIYFYNTEVGSTGNVCLIVSVDGEEIGCMGSPGYFRANLPSGAHSFSFRPNSVIDLGIEMRKFTLETSGGTTMYIESKIILGNENSESVLQSNYVNALSGFTVGWVLVPAVNALRDLESLREWK
jgi:hypothetical protein